MSQKAIPSEGQKQEVPDPIEPQFMVAALILPQNQAVGLGHQDPQHNVQVAASHQHHPHDVDDWGSDPQTTSEDGEHENQEECSESFGDEHEPNQKEPQVSSSSQQLQVAGNQDKDPENKIKEEEIEKKQFLNKDLETTFNYLMFLKRSQGKDPEAN